MQRREFFRAALALPLTGILAPLKKLAAADVGKVKITDVKMRASGSHTQIRIDTDAGISGMGESGVTPAMMKAWMEIYKPLLVEQDPLAIGYHWHRLTTLMHTYMSRIPAMSGIDMALWDLAGRLLNVPVYKLLGGPFREQVPVLHQHRAPQHARSQAVKAWADQFRANPLGFRGLQDQHAHGLRRPHGTIHHGAFGAGSEQAADLVQQCPQGTGPGLRHHGSLPQRVRPGHFQSNGSRGGRDPAEMVRRSAAAAVLRQLGRAETRLPRTAAHRRESARCRRGSIRFSKSRRSTYIYPDIAFCGGITAFMKIAAMAAVFRIPIATHNVGGIHLTMSCIHVGLSIMDFLTSEAAMGGPNGGVLALAKNPPVVKGGMAAKPEGPGLGVEVNEEVFKQRAAGRRGGTEFLDWI